MATYYVATTGNDLTGDGSSALPWATIDKALSKAGLTGDDVISIAAGTYQADASTDVSGSSGHPITIRGAGIGQTILTGKLTVDCAWYVVKDLTVDGFTDSTLAYTGVYLSMMGGGCTDVVIDGCEFTRGIAGVSFQETVNVFPSRVTIQNCLFHHWVGQGAAALVGDDHTIQDCTFRYSAGNDAIRVIGANAIIRRNTFFRIYSPATVGMTGTSTSTVTLGTGTKALTVESGLLFTAGDQVTAFSDANPTAKKMTGFVSSYSGTTLQVLVYSATGSGDVSDWTVILGPDEDNNNHADVIQSFIPSQGIGTTGLRFYSNQILECTSQFGNLENDAANSLSGNWIFYNNKFWKSRITLNNYLPDVSFYNNSIYDTVGFTSGISAKDSGGTKGKALRQKVKNNLFIHIDGVASGDGAYTLQSDGEADYNVLSTQADGAFTSLSAGANSINGGFTKEEIYVDIDNGDFGLVGPIGVGTGLDLSSIFTTDFDGNTRDTWDMGALVSGLPATPSSLAASAISTSAISLSWTNNAIDAAGIRIERSADNSTFTQIADIDPDETSYSVTGLASGTQYWFRVRAYNGNGNSAYSNTANATTQAGPPPPTGGQSVGGDSGLAFFFAV